MSKYKINLLSPAQGETVIGNGKVITPGRTPTVCRDEVWARADGRRQLVVNMQSTMLAVPGGS